MTTKNSISAGSCTMVVNRSAYDPVPVCVNEQQEAEQQTGALLKRLETIKDSLNGMIDKRDSNGSLLLNYWIENLLAQLELLNSVSVKDSLANGIVTTKKAVEDIFESFELLLDELKEASFPSLAEQTVLDKNKKVNKHCAEIAQKVQELIQDLGKNRPSYWESAALILSGAALALTGHIILAPVAVVTGLGWGVYQACFNVKLSVTSATIQLLTKLWNFVQNSVLTAYKYAKEKVWTPVYDRYRPVTYLDKVQISLKSDFGRMLDSEREGIQNEELRHQIKLLSRRVTVLNLTRNLLPFKEDFEETQKISADIFGMLGEDNKSGLLLLMRKVDQMASLSPSGLDSKFDSKMKFLREEIQKYFGEISEQALELKTRCAGLKKRKETYENVKNGGLILGGTALFAGGVSGLLLTLPVGALWFLYEFHHLYRGGILNQAAELLDLVESQKEKLKSVLQDAELANTRKIQQTQQMINLYLYGFVLSFVERRSDHNDEDWNNLSNLVSSDLPSQEDLD